jgi:beta-galactosidase
MKNYIILCRTILLMFIFTQCRQTIPRPNEKLCFDANWLFLRTIDSNAVNVQFDDTKWRKLDLPHDWAVEDTVSRSNKSGIEGGFFIAGQGWYRKHFKGLPEWKGKKVNIRFDGVFMNADLWLNGKHVGHHTHGYSGFSFDITPFLKFDAENVISVKVDNNNPPASRWYSGSGIYRHTWIETTGKIYIPFGGTTITTATSGNQSRIKVQTTVKNETGAEQTLTVRLQFKDSCKIVIAEVKKDQLVTREGILESEISVENAKLWSVETPSLYTLETTILSGQKVLHRASEHFGIRNIAFDKDLGFLLNGEKIILKGVCIHHDAGSLGAAVPDAAILRQLLLLKTLGVNSIRLSHNPHSPVLLDLCDSLGILVIDEMFDKWNGRLTGYNNTATFRKESEEDLKYFIKRDRNRPSVILWTVGNETDEQFGDAKKGIEIFGKLKPIVESLDQSRLVTCAMHPGPDGLSPYSPLINYTDLIAYNYRTHDFPEWKKDFPDEPFLASETKAYQESQVKKSAKIDYLPNTWFLMEKYPFIAGQYIWAGIDYLGESMRWPRKGLTNGLILTNGFFKPYAYFQQSVYSEKPMVHIAVVDDSLAFINDTIKHWQKSWFGPPVVSHWNFNIQKVDSVTVLTYSNCDQVELSVNDISLGIKQLNTFPDRVIKWRIPYTPGKIKALGTKTGTLVIHQLETAGTPYQVQIERETPVLTGNQTEYVALIVSVTDKKKVVQPKSRHKIMFEINGDARIIGVDNGDLEDHSSYKSNEVEVRDGKALVWVQIGKKAGKIAIKGEATGLKTAYLELDMK